MEGPCSLSNESHWTSIHSYDVTQALHQTNKDKNKITLKPHFGE